MSKNEEMYSSWQGHPETQSDKAKNNLLLPIMKVRNNLHINKTETILKQKKNI